MEQAWVKGVSDALKDFEETGSMKRLSWAAAELSQVPREDRPAELVDELDQLAREEARLCADEIMGSVDNSPSSRQEACSRLRRCLEILGENTRVCDALGEVLRDIDRLEAVAGGEIELESDEASRILARHGLSPGDVRQDGDSPTWQRLVKMQEALRYHLESSFVRG